MTGIEYKRIADRLFSAGTRNGWQRCVRHVMPELIDASQLERMEDTGMPKRLCSRARTGVRKLAAAHLNYITPMGEAWFSFVPNGKDEEIGADEKEWYTKAGEKVRDALERSNFYTTLLSTIVDRCATGTGLMLCTETDGVLSFSHVPAGTYAVAENEGHVVDMCVRKFSMTPRQAAEVFGEGNLSVRLSKLNADETQRYTKGCELWHLVMPRDVAPHKTAQGVPAAMRSWASVYLDPAENAHVLKEDGLYEFPYMCTRFIKYGTNVYGTSPLSDIYDVICDEMVTAEAMKQNAQRAALPPLLVPAELADEVDTRSGAMTYVSRELVGGYGGQYPREWATGRNYREGIELLEQQRADIDSALFVDVLQSVTSVDRAMTATEVNARETERMMTFSPSFTQFVSDFQPFLDRIFCVLFRMGELPGNPPGDLFVNNDFSRGEKVLAPKIKYVGLMAKALDRSKHQGLVSMVQFSAGLAQQLGDPALMDMLNMTEVQRTLAADENVPTKCIRSDKEVKAIQQKREEAQQAAMQAQVAQQASAADLNSARAAETLGNRR